MVARRERLDVRWDEATVALAKRLAERRGVKPAVVMREAATIGLAKLSEGVPTLATAGAVADPGEGAGAGTWLTRGERPPVERDFEVRVEAGTMDVPERCTCGHEDSDGRGDVLACPVHGIGPGWDEGMIGKEVPSRPPTTRGVVDVCVRCGMDRDEHERAARRRWDPRIDNGPDPFPGVCAKYVEPSTSTGAVDTARLADAMDPSAPGGIVPGAGSSSSREPAAVTDPRPVAAVPPATGEKDVAEVMLEVVVASLFGVAAAPADRARARRMIFAGKVLVDGQACRNPKQLVAPGTVAVESKSATIG